MQRNFLLITAIFFVLEFYVYQAFKTLTGNHFARIGYWIVTLGVYGFLAYEILNFSRGDRDHQRVQIIASIFLAFVLPKIFAVLFLFMDDILRLINYAYTIFAKPESYYPERRKFLTFAGIGLTSLLSLAFLDGIIFGKYRHRARTVRLKIPGLPEAFKGYKIVQISDVHSGSFQHPEKLQPAIDLINRQNADLVLFTGDMVNNYAEEFLPFIPLFSQIKAKDGKLSVLGNHDYGEYVGWKSPEDKARNIPNLIELQKQAGFIMMRNQNRAIERKGERIYILGVENWGLPPFPQYGDIEKALKGLPQDSVKILMSHDPTHFDEVVKKHPANIQLTLSGHTHGMQFGLDLKNVRWSPVQYRYKKWADLYESAGKYLYVNRGFGVIGYPGRVGVLPEITVFELS